jgi:hypothetical protein
MEGVRDPTGSLTDLQEAWNRLSTRSAVFTSSTALPAPPLITQATFLSWSLHSQRRQVRGPRGPRGEQACSGRDEPVRGTLHQARRQLSDHVVWQRPGSRYACSSMKSCSACCKKTHGCWKLQAGRAATGGSVYCSRIRYALRAPAPVLPQRAHRPPQR